MKCTDEDEFMWWYEEYSVSLFKYIFSMVQESQTAEDILQETFLKAYQYQIHINDKNKVRNFLFRIAHNCTMDFFRKESKIRRLLNGLSKETKVYPSAEKIVEVKEESKRLLDALNGLKVAQKQVILLRKVQGFSIRETAEILNFTESKVKTTLHRANKNLEKLLLKEEDYEEITSFTR
ncbi:RNA polymerase sigma factor [Metabacillus halosaccharovorans]|uniref:RNA polymerase sigma factor n=1 Tax=Metabacillus halosaccharovorans TaxID=930124 RepID=UPI00203E4837|nr:RNA polymerase sigma factor [Metabacillus halosaccharovorans]MCM3439598.1 RNA polymerase sigma factor [Metabacillus halosaccharovorans]